MNTQQAFRVHVYSTKKLILTLLVLILLGTVLLMGVQQIYQISPWAQYIILTLLIVAAFVSSRYLSTRPAKVHIQEKKINIEQRTKEPRIIPISEIKAYAHYEELFLYSLKVTLQSNEILSFIRFKWKDNTDFQSFFEQFQLWVQSSGNGFEEKPITRSGTFYRSPVAVFITLVLLVIYILAVILLNLKDAFAEWNPVWVYYFWVIPIAFFIKMWKAK